MNSSSKKTLLRGATAIIGDLLTYEPRALDILIEGDKINAIEPAGTVGIADEIIDLTGKMLVPGLINGHQHSHEHFQRGRTENLPLELWMHLVRTRQPIALTPRQVYLRTLIGAIECLRTGCTTVVDDMALGAAIDPAKIDAAMQAYDDIGIRALMGFAMMDKPIVDNFPFVLELVPEKLANEMRAGARPDPQAYIALVRRLVKEHHPKANRVGVLVSASAPQRCTEAFLKQIRGLADDLDLPIITHVQETRMQVVTGQMFYGMPMVEYLNKIGFLKPATSLIHAVWLNPREIDALARSGATAQHNPWSNMLLGSGIQPVRPLLDAGVNVSLGSDGSCSTVTVNMLNVLGSAAAVSKLREQDFRKWLTAQEALSAGTVGGAKALGLQEQLGSIRVGAKADLVAYDLNTVTFTPLTDPIRQLVYAERGAGLKFAMVNGDVVIRDAKFTRIDEAKILREIQENYQSLQEQFDVAEDDMAPVLKAMEAIYFRAQASQIAPDTFAARLS
jgi:5-methylthioadenosine/S-adenosylhomocysteine deaminase